GCLILNTADLNVFCTNFVSITKLDLRSEAALYPIGIGELTRILYPLKQLVSLELQFDFATGIRAHIPLPEFFYVPKVVIQLDSIKLLTIELKSIRSHNDMRSNIFGLVFPCLEVLRLKVHPNLFCEVCERYLGSRFP